MLIIALAIVATACDKIEKSPLGDGLLVVIDNQTKGLKGLNFGGDVVLPTSYQNFTLVTYSQHTSRFIAESPDGNQTLFFFKAAHGECSLNSVVSAKKITPMQMFNKEVLFIAEQANGQKYVWHPKITTWLKKGPYDNVFAAVSEYIVQKNGLYGAVSFDGAEIGKPIYQDLYIIQSAGPRFCAKQQDGNFKVYEIMGDLKGSGEIVKYLSPVGTLSQKGFNELKKISDSVISERCFSIENNRRIDPYYDTYIKYCKSIGE